MTNYIAVKEAHRDGGCHVHLLCQWKRNFKTISHKGKLRIASKKLRDIIKGEWDGQVEIEAMCDNDVNGYLKKYLGKYSHIEDALKRAKRKWGNEGDEKHKDTDIKKLWTTYYCGTLNIRQYTCSRKMKKEKQKAKPSDLIKEMNNPTEKEKPKVKRIWRIPDWIKKEKDFEPYNGVVDPNSKCHKLLINYYEKNIKYTEQQALFGCEKT
jgi:hypothetical protein